jgi:UTP--glucose-1-phosphate uridylyltransferase
MKQKITKAVFPVAGLGSRFLPATKATAKEMLPVVDKPLIQYAVEEAIAAGITDMIFITGRHKRAIEDHFDKAYELEVMLKADGQEKLLSIVREVVPSHVNCIYIRQAEPLGLGHAVLCAKPVIQDEPFVVILADDLIDGEPPAIKQMVEIFHRHPYSIIGVQDVPREQTYQYGIISSNPFEADIEEIKNIIEKPKSEQAPSTLAIVGRYILTPRIFHHLKKIQPGAGGEIQLTDGISALMKEEMMLAYRFKGTRYDCGSKLGYLKATVALALKHSELKDEFSAYLRSLN